MKEYIENRIKELKDGLNVNGMPKEYYNSMRNRADELEILVKKLTI
jgi:hypothetical protein